MSPYKAKAPIHLKKMLSPIIQLEATPRVELGNRGFADPGLTTWLCRRLERKTGLGPATPTLARWCSTTELLPQNKMATRMGLEPMISAVTGRHSKPTELPGRINLRRRISDKYYYTDLEKPCQRIKQKSDKFVK